MSTERSFLDMVREADKDWDKERLHPVVYEWPSGHERRDPGRYAPEDTGE